MRNVVLSRLKGDFCAIAVIGQAKLVCIHVDGFRSLKAVQDQIGRVFSRRGAVDDADGRDVDVFGGDGVVFCGFGRLEA